MHLRYPYETSAVKRYGTDNLDSVIRTWHRGGLDELDLARRQSMIYLFRVENHFRSIERAFADQPFAEFFDLYMEYFAKATEQLQLGVALVRSLQPPQFCGGEQ